MTSNERYALDAAKAILISKVSNMGTIYANRANGEDAAEFFKALYEGILTVANSTTKND